MSGKRVPCIEMGAYAYLPKEKLEEIVPFLEDILESSDGLSSLGRTMEEVRGEILEGV